MVTAKILGPLIITQKHFARRVGNFPVKSMRLLLSQLYACKNKQYTPVFWKKIRISNVNLIKLFNDSFPKNMR